MNTIHNRVALITGGTRGIGLAIAKKLAQEGYKLSLIYSHNEAAAQSALQEIKTSTSEVNIIQADVTIPKDMTKAFTKTEEAFGAVDVVINSAGIMLLGSIAELNLEDLDRMIGTNVRGTFIVNQLAAQRIRSGGAIINLSTSVTKLAFPQYGAYAASKGAVDAIIPILAKELRGKDITVNAIAPGPTATELFFEGKDKEIIASLSKASPLERLGTPEDMAEVVAFLAGPARWINGQVIYTNGGII